MSPQFGRNPSVVELTRAGLKNEVAAALIRKMGRLIFVNSMSDTFHRDIPDWRIAAWFELFKHFPDHQFQVLTKRPLRMLNFQRDYYPKGFPPNIWAGTSVEDQRVRGRIDILRQVKAKVRFVSFEPLIGDVGRLDFTGIHWAIVGGESDNKAPRP